MRARRFGILGTFGLLMFGCGGTAAVAPTAVEPTAHTQTRHSTPSSAPAATARSGSSDGATCEDAQAQNVEEMDLHGGGPADLSAKDFAPVLNNGTYLNACEVPEASGIQICVAVRSGVAVGVTVTIDPANPDLEVCVAKQVRALAFASHPKMDIVRVHF